MADLHFFSFSRFARLGLLLALWGHSEALQAQPTEKTPEKPPMEAMDAKVEAARVATEYARLAGLPAVSVGQSEHYTVGLPEKAQRFQAGVLAAMDRYHAAALKGVGGQAAQASFAYWLAFGPRAGKMAGLAKQFVPEENQEKVEMAQAMKKAMLEDSDLQALWQGWVATWR